LPERFAAVDLGASSGRVFRGTLADDRIALDEITRFANRPVALPDGLHWDLTGLFTAMVDGIREAGAPGGVGIDTWGVDYGLLDGDGRLLGLPFHYRDDRTEGMVQRAESRVPPEELYAVTGIQTMPINTVYQLLAEAGSAALAGAARLLLLPDLLAYWLSGQAAGEITAASTTGLLDARSGTWAHELIDRLGLPTDLFGELVEPGADLGPALAQHDLDGLPVRAVAGHDTASAFVGAPVVGDGAAILATGTWCLLGLELEAPVLTEGAREANLTNERGIDGGTRLLKNVMGLWLEQECARTWGADFPELHREADRVDGAPPLFDPDDEVFLTPGDAPARIAEVCRAAGQRAPDSRGETIRSIHLSLACRYRAVLERLEQVAGTTIERIHVIGGGTRNAAMCRLTADLCDREVLAGPVEATALGNVLVQARAAGALHSRDDMRAVAAASAAPATYEPSPEREQAEATYARFLEVTGELSRTGGTP
jgi:rhamnulokinase